MASLLKPRKLSKGPRPAHHADHTATLFQNPWMQPKGIIASSQALWESGLPIEWAREIEAHHLSLVKVVKPNFEKDANHRDAIKATWLGHAGYLVELPTDPSGSVPPTRILFDPVWSNRASPSQYAGPQRRLPPPCVLEDLPEFHYVVISHNHYDHLDWPTIEKIWKVRGHNVHFIVPLGNKAWFQSGGITPANVIELDWWDEEVLQPPTGALPVTFVCAPAQHSSGRGVRDQRSTLWASWIAKQTTPSGQTASVYHAGDTGYMTERGPCPAFVEIGQRHGPLDLALLPIWRGGSLSFVSAAGLRVTHHDLLDGLHASPEHALRLARDVQARHSLAMHFGTFAGSDSEAAEPLLELGEARRKMGVGDWSEEGGFGWIDVGATAVVPVGDASRGSIQQEEEEEREVAKGLVD